MGIEIMLLLDSWVIIVDEEELRVDLPIFSRKCDFD